MKNLFNIPKPAFQITVNFGLLQFFYYFNFFWLIQNVYFLQNGITFSQLSILLGILSGTILLFEIPSGILADKFGRKAIIVIGKFSFLLGIISFIFLNNFSGFILGMFLWGIHESFISGAQEALVFDNLKSNGQEILFKKILAIATVSREIGLGIGVLIAGAITHLSLNYNLIGSIIIAVLCLITAMALPKAPVSVTSYEKRLKEHLIDANSNIAKDPELFKIILFTLSVLVSYLVITEFFVVSLTELNLDFRIIGVIAFIEMLFFSLGTIISHKLNVLNYEKTYKTLSFLMAIVILGITTKNTILVVFAWLILRSMKAAAEIISNSDWQHRIESTSRATTTSVKSFLSNIFYIPVALLFGYIADKTSLFTAFYFIAFTTALYFLIFAFLRNKPDTGYTET